jgi:hypothetical protein
MSSATDQAANDDVTSRPLIITTRRSMHIFELSGAVLNYNAGLARERLISLMNKGKTENNDKNGNQLEQGDDNQDGR